MFAHAHMTDWDLSKEEILVIREKSEIFVSHMAGEGMPYSDIDVKGKMDKAFNLYQRSLEGTDEELLKDVQNVAGWLKDQDWFNQTFAQSFINMLVDISRADNIVHDNEVGSIRALSQFWDVESPF